MKALALLGLSILGLLAAFLWTLILLAAFAFVVAVLASVPNWLGKLGAPRLDSRAKPAEQSHLA